MSVEEKVLTDWQIAAIAAIKEGDFEKAMKILDECTLDDDDEEFDPDWEDPDDDDFDEDEESEDDDDNDLDPDWEDEDED